MSNIAPIRTTEEINTIINNARIALASLGEDIINEELAGIDDTNVLHRDKKYRLLLIDIYLGTILDKSGNILNYFQASANTIKFNKILTGLLNLANMSGPAIPLLLQRTSSLQFLPTGLTVGGDLSGNLPNPHVVGINGTLLSGLGTGLLKLNAGVPSIATSGTDYAPATSGSSILKGNGAGGFSNASAGTDYAPATAGSSILYGNGSGGFSNVTIGANLTFVAGTLSASSSGITNSAAANELMKSDGTNAVSSGIFNPSTADLYMGTGKAGTTRIIQADGSGSDINLQIFAKGTGSITVGTFGNLNMAGVGTTGTTVGGSAVSSGTPPDNSFKGTGVSGTATVAGRVVVVGGGSAITGIAGGDAYIAGGAAVVGNADGGNVNIYGGAKVGSGTNGSVLIGVGPNIGAVNIAASTGTLGFFGSAGVVKQSAVTTSQGIADALTAYGLLPSSTIATGVPGGATNELQKNDGSGGFAGSGVLSTSSGALSNLASLTGVAGTRLLITNGTDGIRLNATSSDIIIDNNTSFFGTPSYGGGSFVMFIANRSVAPGSNPTGGGILYAESGALKWRGSGGTVTTIANA